VKSGIIRIVLEQKFQNFTKRNFEVFDSFIIVIIRILAGFQNEYRHVINKEGNIIPHNIAFANLPRKFMLNIIRDLNALFIYLFILFYIVY
jgi:hypothetical protein